MRHMWAVVLVLLLVPLGGCLTTPPGPGASERAGSGLAPMRGPTGEDVIQMHIALIERPADDPYLNRGVWAQVDEQGLRYDGGPNLEQKALLARNGFRVGQLIGAPSAELCRLVASERSCVNPNCRTMRANRPVDLFLGPVWSHCEFELKQENSSVTVDLDQANCQLQVTPLLMEEGRTLVRFTPVIKHGEMQRSTGVGIDPSGTRYWDMKVEQAKETYPELSWELSVGPNENILIGTGPERGDTLGQRCFISTEGVKPTQRLLVLRVGRNAQAQENLQDESVLARAPLALQVTQTAYRASSP